MAEIGVSSGLNEQLHRQVVCLPLCSHVAETVPHQDSLCSYSDKLFSFLLVFVLNTMVSHKEDLPGSYLSKLSQFPMYRNLCQPSPFSIGPLQTKDSSAIILQRLYGPYVNSKPSQYTSGVHILGLLDRRPERGLTIFPLKKVIQPCISISNGCNAKFAY